MLDVVKVFMERDGMTKKEAVNYYRELRKEIHEIMSSGCSDSEMENEVEELLYGEGLEMDCLFDFI